MLTWAVTAHVTAALSLAGEVIRRTQAQYLARSGVEKAIRAVMVDTNEWDGPGEGWSIPQEFSKIELGGGWAAVGWTSRGSGGAIVTNYGVVDEERKVSVNRAPQPLLAALFETAAGLDSAKAAATAACIVDWRDGNDEPLPDGAESSYYQGLNPPYSCHNNLLDVLEELRLVKGVDGGLLDSIRDYVTVYGSGRININTAERIVLLSAAIAVGGAERRVCEDLVDKILTARQEHLFTARAQVANSIRDLSAEERTLLNRMVNVNAGVLDVASRHFGGTSWGRVRGSSAAGARVIFVCDRTNGKIRFWHED